MEKNSIGSKKKNIFEIRRGYRENLWRQTITFYYDYMHVYEGKKYSYIYHINIVKIGYGRFIYDVMHHRLAHPKSRINLKFVLKIDDEISKVQIY